MKTLFMGRPATRIFQMPQLTDDEIIVVRSIIEKDKRMRWLGTMMRNVAAWIVAVLAAITVGWDWLVRIIKGAAQ